jgi:SAM-dependent methyltransferase
VAGYSSQEGVAANPGNILPPVRRGPVPSSFRQLLGRYAFRPHSWPLHPAAPGKHRLLDIGCGTAHKLVEFAQRGYEVWGTDVSPDALARAKELIPSGAFFQGELLKLGLPAGHFHCIRLDNVLEHVPNPAAVLKECVRLLAPGGELFIFVPNGASPSLRLLGRYSISSWIPFHLTLFTPKAMGILCRQAGLPQVRVLGYVPASWPALTLMQLLRKDNAWLRSPLYPRWFGVLFYPLGMVRWPLMLAEELVVCAKPT